MSVLTRFPALNAKAIFLITGMLLLFALGGFAQSYYGKNKYRSFDIYINNVLLQTVNLDNTIGDKCINVDYKLPDALV